MKEKNYFVNILLAAELGILSLTGLLIRTFLPGAVLPEISIPLIVLLSLIPLTAECYTKAPRGKNHLISILLAGVSFSVLPWCGGLLREMPLWKMFLISCAVYGIVSLLYQGQAERIPAKNKKTAPAINAVLLWLASLCTLGLL